MSAEPNHHINTPERRWTRRELAGLIAVVWVLAVLAYLALTVTP